MRQTYKTVNNEKPITTINNLTKTECAYIAGMVDGDGSICKLKNRESFICRVQIHNSCETLITWLNKKIGMGNIEHKPPATDKQGYKHTKDRWTYSICSKVDVVKILIQIKPYLIIKKQNAIEILKFIPTMRRPTKYRKKGSGLKR